MRWILLKLGVVCSGHERVIELVHKVLGVAILVGSLLGGDRVLLHAVMYEYA